MTVPFLACFKSERKSFGLPAKLTRAVHVYRLVSFAGETGNLIRACCKLFAFKYILSPLHTFVNPCSQFVHKITDFCLHLIHTSVKSVLYHITIVKENY